MKKACSLLLSGLMILSIIGMFSACSSEKENYLSSLPAHSTMVFKLNVAQLVTKSTILDNPMVNAMLMQADQQVPDALKDKFNEIKNNPAASGIDFEKPMAIAVEMGNIDPSSYVEFPQPSLVYVTAISDVNKFDELMKELVETEPSMVLSETEGVKQIQLPEGFSMAYNESRLVLTYGENMNAVSLANQKSEESMLAHPNFANFAANNQDCSIFMDYDWIMETVLEAQKSISNQTAISPELIEYMKDMCLFGSMNFEKGKVVGDMKIYTSELAQEYIDKFYFKPSDKLVGLLPENSYLGFNFAVKNYAECLKFIGENERQQIEQMLQQYGVSMEMINNINGNILMGVYEDASNALNPGFVIAVECKDRTLFDKVKEMLHISEEGDVCDIPTLGYRISYVDNVVVVSTKELYEQCLAKGSVGAWEKSWKGTTLGDALSKGGMAVDFQSISKSQLLGQFSNEVAVALSILKQLDTFTLQMESKTSTYSELTFMNKDKNALVQLIAIGISISAGMSDTPSIVWAN